MPVVIHCPTCRNPLTAHESQSGLPVVCPACRHPLTVPVLAPVAATVSAPERNPFETSEPAAPRSTRRAKAERKPIAAATVFFIVVGLLVAVVMTLVLYDRIEVYYDKQRFRTVSDELVTLIIKQQAREHELEVKDKRFRDPLVDRQTLFKADAEWKRLEEQISKLDYERSQLIRAHPGWGR